MRIVYSAGNRVGADTQLYRFLKNTSHEIKIAAYIKSSNNLSHIDWTLDALYHKYSKTDKEKIFDLFNSYNIPRVGMNEIEILVEEVSEFNPDLIICDYEPIMSNVASAIGAKLWYCSPVHMLDGIDWGYGKLKYRGLLENTRKALPRLPIPDKTFIYSPFCDFEKAPILKSGYEWIRPYHVSCDSSNNEVGIAVVTDYSRISELSKILNCIPPFCFTLFSHSIYNLSHLESINISDESVYQKVLNNCRWLFTTGDTNFISDALYGNINRVAVSPDLDDIEALLNAILIEEYDVGDDLAQVEYLEQYSVEHIQKSFEKSLNNREKIIKKENYRTLDEWIEHENSS